MAAIASRLVRVHGLSVARSRVSGAIRMRRPRGMMFMSSSPVVTEPSVSSSVSSSSSPDLSSSCASPVAAPAAPLQVDDEGPVSWREQEALSGGASSPLEASVSGGASEQQPMSDDVPVMSGGESDALVAAVPLGSWPSDYALRFIDAVRENLDVPWWAAIVVTTVSIRGALLPISFETMRHAARMQKAKPEMEVLQARMAADPTAKQDPARGAMYQRQMSALLEKHQVKMYRVFMFPFAQLPVFTSMFFGLRRLGDHFPDAANGGALWFHDLTVADPLMALPVATSLLFLGMVELGADGANAQQGANSKIFKNAMRALALAMIPLTASMPTSVFCYWFTANTFSLLQTTLLNKVPGARSLLGLPPLPRQTSSAAATGALGADLKEAWHKLSSALRAARDKDKPPQVAADVFKHKVKDNAFLASRPHTAVETFAHSPKAKTSRRAAANSRSRAPPKKAHKKK